MLTCSHSVIPHTDDYRKEPIPLVELHTNLHLLGGEKSREQMEIGADNVDKLCDLIIPLGTGALGDCQISNGKGGFKDLTGWKVGLVFFQFELICVFSLKAFFRI